MHTEFGEPSAIVGPPDSYPAVRYLIVGHVAKDLTPRGPRLGGTAAYSALTARALGYAPGLVTAYDNNIDLTPLAGLACAGVASASSTTFENIYSPAGRKQYLRARALPLTLAAVPVAWRTVPIIHIGPIAGEVPADLVNALAGDGQFVGLTPQGWMRRWDDEGQVWPASWPEALTLLPLVTATVTSLEDLQGDWDTAQRWAAVAQTLVITEGAHGCTVFARGQAAQHLPAPAVNEVDPTGAGDVFAAAFFVRLHETHSPHEAARFANGVAANSVTQVGLAGVPEARDYGGDAE
jgi:sugar/nucleoside kinase (ribokinase family)